MVYINFNTSELPDIEKYKKALFAEIYYLKEHGGRKYRVTNGYLLRSDNKGYYYSFDLETELHIADDTPMVIQVKDDEGDGIVQFCEDFQIVVSCTKYLGEKISRAFITVAPWKLLEALNKRFEQRKCIKDNKVSEALTNNGPRLATDRPIEEIPKGQDEVIKKVTNEPVCVVWGPPGTGKTHTMSEIAIKFLKQKKRVLIVSHSNVSVDGVVKKIYELLSSRTEDELYHDGKILRYGYVRDEEIANNSYISSFMYALKKNPEDAKNIKKLQKEDTRIRKTNGLHSPLLLDIRKEIKDIKTKIKAYEEKCVSEAQIVATTISKIVMDHIFEYAMYDVVMFDEVSMAYVLQVLCAAAYAREHMVCVGDFMQLAPIVQSAGAHALQEDIFTYLGINRGGKPYYHPWLVMLDEQRRMHPNIAEFSSRYIYKGLLKNHESVVHGRDDIIKKPLFEGNPVNILDLTGSYCATFKNEDNSRFNILSAALSFATSIKCNENVSSVSIITPYVAQTRLMRAMILDYSDSKNQKNNVRCATVHQFQGTESDVIIFDAVESYPYHKPGFLMRKNSDSIKRLINVAVTRAKGKLITVSNARFWEKIYSKTNHMMFRLIEYSKSKGKVYSHYEIDRSLENVINNLSLQGVVDFYDSSRDCLDLFIEELKSAQVDVIVSLPTGDLDNDQSNKMLEVLNGLIKKGIKVKVNAKEYDELTDEWQAVSSQTKNAVFPMVIIDDKITWYGMPLANWTFKDGNAIYTSPLKLTIRIKGKRTAELIKSLASLEITEAKETRNRTTKNESDELKNSGFARYISETEKCSKCGAPMKLAKGRNGNSYMRCSCCSNTGLIAKELLNNYINLRGVKCPEHGCRIYAGLGRYGIYVKCGAGHYLKPDEV